MVELMPILDLVSVRGLANTTCRTVVGTSASAQHTAISNRSKWTMESSFTVAATAGPSNLTSPAPVAGTNPQAV